MAFRLATSAQGRAVLFDAGLMDPLANTD